MTKLVDYYFSPTSPWTYLGHQRFAEIARRHGAGVNVKPVDYGRIFPVSGGLPLKQRAAQRQAYRFMELRRFREQLGVPSTSSRSTSRPGRTRRRSPSSPREHTTARPRR